MARVIEITVSPKGDSHPQRAAGLAPSSLPTIVSSIDGRGL